MTYWQRRARVFWYRNVSPGVFEREPHFRALLRELARSGLRATGLLVAVGVGLYMGYRLMGGQPVVWDEPAGAAGAATVQLWDKVLIFVLSLVLVALSGLRVGLRASRLATAVYLLTVAWFVVLTNFAPGNYNMSAAWLTLLLVVGVGMVPLRPMQVLLLGLAISAEYWYFAVFTPGIAGDQPRLVFLILVTIVITAVSAVLYTSRFRQYRSLRRIALMKDYAAARSQRLEQVLQRERQMQDQLVQQEKLASLGQLTAGIAHEIKNPLNFVTNFASLAHDQAQEIQEVLSEDPDRTARAVLDDLAETLNDLLTNTERIAEHGRRADGIVKGMLAHSRATPGEREPIDLNKLLAEYAGLAYHGMRARHRLDVDLQKDFDETLPPVPMVREEVGRVFLNLLGNAFDAVRVRAEQAAQQGVPYDAPVVRVATHHTDTHAVVVISDNGIGMSEEVAARVFEPFFTTKPAGEGTGLGLSLTHEVVTQGHSGTISVESTEGERTTFTVTLPLRVESEPESAPVKGSPVR